MIFVDTSAWLAVADPKDDHHEAAVAEHRELIAGRRGRLITSDYVIDETLTLVRGRLGGSAAGTFAKSLAASRSVQIVWVGQQHYEPALSLFLSQRGTAWSFTDCTSFVLMRELSVPTAFAFDNDFTEAGFERRPQD